MRFRCKHNRVQPVYPCDRDLAKHLGNGLRMKSLRGKREQTICFNPVLGGIAALKIILVAFHIKSVERGALTCSRVVY